MGVLATALRTLGLAALAGASVPACSPLADPGRSEASQPGAPGQAPAPAPARLPSAAPDMQVAQLKTKSDLPPVVPTLGGSGDLFELPAVVPPGRTEIRPPQPVFLLSGQISGHPARRVQALSLAGGHDHSADVRGADRTFAFANIDPWYYQLALVGADTTLLIRKVILVEPAKPVFIRIEVQPGGRQAKVDDLAVPIETHRTGGS